jgi:hypothetical protein
MKPGQGALLELCVVLLFVGGFGIFELVTLRRDRRRPPGDAVDARPEQESRPAPESRPAQQSEGPSRHPEG